MGRQRNETGAISVLLAAISLGLVVLVLAGSNAAGLLGVRREAQRAANLAALAGAANLPLLGLLSSPEPQSTSCAQVDKTFAPSSALLTPELGDGTVPRCGDGVTVTAEADWARVEAVRDALALLLGSLNLPADLCAAVEPVLDPIDPVLDPVLEDPILEETTDTVLEPIDPVLDPIVKDPIKVVGLSFSSASSASADLIDPLLGELTDLECASLAGAIRGLPDNLSPAVITPRVKVLVQGLYEAFVPMPAFAGEHAVDAEATARRRFKNLVVLPAVNGAPQPLDDLNPTATAARDTLLPELESAATALGTALAPYLPAGVAFDLSGLFVDLYDIYDPPSTAPAPSPLEVAEAAVASGEPVVLLRLFTVPVLGIPALDFTAAYLTKLSDGSFEAVPVPVAQLSAASGLFSASLVRSTGATP